jgi:hypothetical protein
MIIIRIQLNVFFARYVSFRGLDNVLFKVASIKVHEIRLIPVKAVNTKFILNNFIEVLGKKTNDLRFGVVVRRVNRRGTPRKRRVFFLPRVV